MHRYAVMALRSKPLSRNATLRTTTSLAKVCILNPTKPLFAQQLFGFLFQGLLRGFCRAWCQPYLFEWAMFSLAGHGLSWPLGFSWFWWHRVQDRCQRADLKTSRPKSEPGDGLSMSCLVKFLSLVQSTLMAQIGLVLNILGITCRSVLVPWNAVIQIRNVGIWNLTII